MYDEKSNLIYLLFFYILRSCKCTFINQEQLYKNESNLVICQGENLKYFDKNNEKRVTLISLCPKLNIGSINNRILIIYSCPESKVGFCPADQKAYV